MVFEIRMKSCRECGKNIILEKLNTTKMYTVYNALIIKSFSYPIFAEKTQSDLSNYKNY